MLSDISNSDYVGIEDISDYTQTPAFSRTQSFTRGYSLRIAYFHPRKVHLYAGLQAGT